MDELRELPTEQLLEMLSKYTADYTRMIRDGASDAEHTACQQTLMQLQTEILFRKQTFSEEGFNFESTSSE